MSKSKRLRNADIRDVYRLLSDLRELRHDRAALDAHLTEELCRLIDASSGMVGCVDDWRPGGAIAIRRLTIGGPENSRLLAITQTLWQQGTSQWDDPSFAEGVKVDDRVFVCPIHEMVSEQTLKADYSTYLQVGREADYKDHLLGWFHKDLARNIFVFSMQRWGKTQKRFNGRETAMGRLLIDELRWLHDTGRLDSIVPEQLSPRQAQVLRLLLAGHPPKQIAIHLDLSTHTVRDHIQRLYQIFQVSGREELTARFLKQPPWSPMM